MDIRERERNGAREGGNRKAEGLAKFLTFSYKIGLFLNNNRTF
jgi:hypothetical protein